MNPIPLELKQKAIAQRMAGASYATISSSTGISISTLQTIFRTEKLAKGSATATLVAKVNSDLLNDTVLQKLVARETKNLIRSELAIANQIIDQAALTIEQLHSFNAPTRAKALSSLANSINVASQVARRALNGNDVESNTLPVLQIIRMTDDETLEIRKRQEGE